MERKQAFIDAAQEYYRIARSTDRTGEPQAMQHAVYKLRELTPLLTDAPPKVRQAVADVAAHAHADLALWMNTAADALAQWNGEPDETTETIPTVRALMARIRCKSRTTASGYFNRGVLKTYWATRTPEGAIIPSRVLNELQNRTHGGKNKRKRTYN